MNYDAYVVDIQHGMSRAQEAIRQLRALQAIDDRPTAMVRISELSSKEVGLYLDAGFMGALTLAFEPLPAVFLLLAMPEKIVYGFWRSVPSDVPSRNIQVFVQV